MIPSPAPHPPLRLGIVPYLNILPLIEGLDARIPRSQWIRATPRELAGLLGSGELDVASLPIFEVLRDGGYSLIPGCAIACDGAVRSVQLFSKVPIPRIRSILFDRASLTSANLARVVLADAYGLRPHGATSSAPLAADFDWERHEAEAFLCIGDTALRWEGAFPHALDLGTAWKALTNLPFVFAAWAVRSDANLSGEQIEWFAEARAAGARAVPALAARHAAAGGLQARQVEDYLRDSVRYSLGRAELAGIEEFRRRLVAHGLLAEGTAGVRLLMPGAELPAYG